ncbi:outer membrane beta-barrel family protein [Empedobacter sedimenti]|uniref:outer membrane beta-barrel family protein n=1 Tax=Empedobacter sedimenti TaxID=3042610 RepID=UPI0024A76155|nr:outer membrane beta-barrel family protein [Empedobacter sedimenti]
MKFLQIILFIISTSIFAQEKYSITGNLTSEKDQKPILAEIVLYDDLQNIIKTTHTENSKFEFKELEPKTYSISIIYNKTIQEEKPFYLNENKTFQLTFNETIHINEVIVKGRKETFKIENGNLIVDVANSTLNKTTNSTELLSKLPGIILGADKESLTMIGKGTPLLYLDDQQVDFSTLLGLAVEDIKSIEIIKNPSAKYEANGKSVVKINLKSSKKEGLKLTLQETVSFKRKFNNYFNSTFQFRKNKSEFKINASYNQLNPWEGNGFDYTVKGKNIASDYLIKSETKRPHFIVNTSYFQELNDTGDYLSFAINSNFRKDKGLIDTNTNYTENNVNQSILTLNDNENHRNFVNTLMNYNKNIKSIDASILTGLQYTIYNTGTTYDFYNNINDKGLSYNQSRYQKYRINVVAAKFDVEKKLESDQKIEFGSRFTYAKAKTNNETIFQNNQTEHFLYHFTELNIAGYTQYSKDYEDWNYKAGLRFETTNSEGFNETKQLTDIDKKYVDWFPNAEINYKINENNNLTFFYKRSIDRPNYSNISSGNLYGSPYIEYSGNFNILPTYTNTISANYALKNWSFTVSYYQSKNPLGYTLVYDDSRNISTFTSVNFDKEKNYSFGIDAPFQYKFWTSQTSLYLIYSEIEDKTAYLRKSTPYLYLYSNHNFRIGKDFNFMLDGYWLTKRTEGIYERNSQVIVNLGLSKSYKNFDFTVRFNDLFKQMEFREVLDYKQINSKNVFHVDNQEFSVGIKYNFGRLNKSISKESKVNEDENRIR